MASVLSYENLVHAVAGAVGSMTAMTVFFPLDTARLRLQVDEKRKSKTTHMVLLEIIKEEGLLAPYRGWFPVISSLCCSNFVYFYTFNSLKTVWVKGQHSTTGKDLIVGFVAGVVNVLLTTPLWVVNTRLKLQGAKFRNEDIVPTNYSGIIAFLFGCVRHWCDSQSHCHHGHLSHADSTVNSEVWTSQTKPRKQNTGESSERSLSSAPTSEAFWNNGTLQRP
uniref:Solute carrier family 25 member 17 n=1 Tax=Sus scrofa TaxID=9823 RepID=A0A8D0QQL5_PIG